MPAHTILAIGPSRQCLRGAPSEFRRPAIRILIQGYRIATGQSRESMMALVTNSLRAVLIVSVATTFAVGGTSLHELLTDTLNRAITQVMTGEDENAYDSIDRSLGYMQVALSSIDQLQVGGSQIVQEAKTRNQWFTGIGIAGPAITGGAMLLLNKVAMALVVGAGSAVHPAPAVRADQAVVPQVVMQ
jgi:type IV secretion system protein VirB6